MAGCLLELASFDAFLRLASCSCLSATGYLAAGGNTWFNKCAKACMFLHSCPPSGVMVERTRILLRQRIGWILGWRRSGSCDF